jgi:hypothetical protein
MASEEQQAETSNAGKDAGLRRDEGIVVTDSIVGRDERGGLVSSP